MNDIPFMVKLEEGNALILKIQLENGDAVLTYVYGCKDKNDNLYVFRTEADARLAANKNGWRYVG
jgi:hypothetical protein